MNINFFQPIITHYRKSLIKEILKLMPNTLFIGAKSYYNNVPLTGINSNVKNELSYLQIKIFNHRIFYFIGGMKYLLSSKCKKVVLTGFDPHLLHIYIYVLLLKVLSKEFIWWSHANYGNQGSFGVYVRKFFYNLSSSILVYSNQGKERLIKIGINSDKITVINNCLNYIDYGHINYDKDAILNKKGAVLNLLITGKLNKVKKIHLLLYSIKELLSLGHQVNCNIVGDGEEESNLKQLSKKLEIESSVTFHGAIFDVEIHKFFMQADIYVIPGSVGLSIVHAFSFGLPLITTDNLKEHRPEIEIFENGINGLFYGSNNSLTTQILSMYEILKLNRSKVYDNCIRSIVENEYLPKNVALKIYKTLSK